LNLRCSQKDLMEAVAIVNSAIEANKSSALDFSGIIIEFSDESLRLSGYNSEFFIFYSIEAEVFEAGKFALKAKMLSDILNHLPDESICISIANKNEVEIECGTYKGKLKTVNYEYYPSLDNIEIGTKICISFDKFREMVRGSFYDKPKGNFTITQGILMKVKDKKLKLIGTDCSYFSRIEYDINTMDECYALIDGNLLNDITKILYKGDKHYELEITLCSRYLLFELDNMKIYSRLYEENSYPDYENFLLSMEFASVVYTNRLELLRRLECAILLEVSYTGRETFRLKLQTKEGIIRINAKSCFGNSEDEVDIILEGTPFTIRVLPNMLINALKHLNDEEVILSLSKEQNIYSLRNKLNEQYKYYLCVLYNNE